MNKRKQTMRKYFQILKRLLIFAWFSTQKVMLCFSMSLEQRLCPLWLFLVWPAVEKFLIYIRGKNQKWRPNVENLLTNLSSIACLAASSIMKHDVDDRCPKHFSSRDKSPNSTLFSVARALSCSPLIFSNPDSNQKYYKIWLL